MHSVRFVISGKVQGVFFRASTRNEARRLGLHGHARNLSDGRVEVIAYGSRAFLFSSGVSPPKDRYRSADGRCGTAR